MMSTTKTPRRLRWMAVAAMALLLAACGRAPSGAAGAGEQASARAATTAAEDEATPPARNLILMIGDGMGPQQVGLLEDYARLAPNSVYDGRETAMTRLAREGVVGMSRTNPPGALVVDSACSATQLASGVPAPLEGIGVDVDGYPVDTVLLAAARSGRATGLVTDTRITHATPAGFAAHVGHRTQESEIAAHLIDHRVDVLLSGGARFFFGADLPDDPDEATALTGGAFTPTSRRTDDRDLIAEAREAGYHVTFDRHGLQDPDGTPLLGLFADSSMTNAITDRRERDDESRTYPSLVEMSLAALHTLDRNEEGFFLMIEGGQIDWAAHDNDAGRLLHEMIRFDEAIEAVLDWAEGRDDTVIVVTADHETGGFGFSYSGINIPGPQERPGPAFAERSYHPNFNFGPFDVLDGLHAQSMTYRQFLTAIQTAQEEGHEDLPGLLVELVNTHTRFPITREDAESILRTQPNHMRVEGNSYLELETRPHMCVYDAFYPYYMDGHMGNLARVQANQTHAVWNTGTHTHTPVPVLAWGPEAHTRPLDRLLHHIEVGQTLFRILGLERDDPYDPGFEL